MSVGVMSAVSKKKDGEKKRRGQCRVPKADRKIGYAKHGDCGRKMGRRFRWW